MSLNFKASLSSFLFYKIFLIFIIEKNFTFYLSYCTLLWDCAFSLRLKINSKLKLLTVISLFFLAFLCGFFLSGEKCELFESFFSIGVDCD